MTRYQAAARWGIDPVRFCKRLHPEWQAELIAAFLYERQLEAVVQQDAESKRVGRDRTANKPVNQGAAPARTDAK